MEDMELEEGEACSYHYDGDGGLDSSIDPDVDLSYIDDRIQHVLGHFQKDFEGGVSAENLGAKFGGYGSFLPTYHRSPALGSSPSNIRLDDAPKPSRTSHFKDGHHHAVVSHSEPQQERHPTACTSSRPVPPVKELAEREWPSPSVPCEDVDSRNESAKLLNRKMMKLRFKVGSSNVSSQKKAAIYNGLGLVASPASSWEESQSGSEGMLREHQDSPLESPTSILQMMTSFPVLGDMLLSPLPDYLLKFTKMQKPQENYRPVIVSGLGAHGSNYLKDIWKVPQIKKVKSQERNDTSTASESGNRKGSRNNSAVFGSKELDIDAASKEMVSRTSQLPPTSNVDTPRDNITKSSGVAFDKSKGGNECISRKKLFNDLMAEETLNSKHMYNCTGVEKQEVQPSEEFLEDREEIPANVCLVQAKKGSHDEGGENYDIMASSQRKDHLNMPPVKKKPSSRGKEKSKESQGQVTLATDVSEGTLRDFASKNRSMESIQERDSHSKTKLGKLKADKHFQNGTDIYKDFFGDVEFEEEDQQKMVVKDSETVQRSILVPDSEQRKRSKGKINAKLLTAKAHLDSATGVVPGSGVSMPCATSASGFPSPEEDNGVYCTKCQKWRLFPPGTDQQNLPEKWVCSMLNWLPPGMNSCSVSQEETTNAVTAMLQATSPDAPNHSNGNLGLSNLVSGSPHYDEVHIQGLQALHSGLNTKCPAEVSDSVNKSLQISAIDRSVNDVYHCSLRAEDDVHRLSKSSCGRAATEATREKVSKHSSEGGDVSKLKARRGHDQDHSKLSKKARRIGTNHNGEDWTRDHGGLSERIGKNSNNTLLAEIPYGNQKSYLEALNISACDAAGKPVMDDHPSRKAAASMNCVFVGDRVPGEGESITKRRKIKESRSYPTSSSHLPIRQQENGALGGESESKGEQATRVNSERNGSRRERRIDEESGQIKKMQSNDDLESTGVASLKREPGLTQPPAPATSCSSKASGSVKSKASFHETRGSPAESVSSSPMRSPKPDNLTIARETISEKHDLEDAATIPLGSLRMCSTGELVGRGDQSRSYGHDGTATVAPNGSHESSILEPDRDNLSGNSDKSKAAPSPEISNHLSSNSGQENSGHDNQYPTKVLNSDKCSAEERKSRKSCSGGTLNVAESEKVSSARPKDKYRKSQTESMENLKIPDLSKDKDCRADKEGKVRDVRSYTQNTSAKGDESEHRHIKKKDSAGKPGWTSKTRTQSNLRDARCSKVAVSNPNSDDSEFSLKKISSGKAERVDIVCGTEKPVASPDISAYKIEIPRDSSKPVLKLPSSNGVDDQHASLSNGNDALEVPRHIKKVEHQNAIQQKSSRHIASNGHRIRDINAPSPARRESTSYAAVNALKEAKDLKHLADRLKNGGSNGESIGLYFQAALKFLHGAALLESGNSESSKRGDIAQSIQIYSSTAKLCEFCAHEYEKSKDMASAALAYKCMEVAYLKVVYSSHNNASKDRQELQTALKMIPPGVSPASSASDVDNVNNIANTEKIGQSKDASSPQVAGNQIIAAAKRPNFVQLLKFARDVSNAMEASRKSMIAFSAASTYTSDPKLKEAISSTKTALDYHFQDVEGLLQLVRVATEAIGR